MGQDELTRAMLLYLGFGAVVPLQSLASFEKKHAGLDRRSSELEKNICLSPAFVDFRRFFFQFASPLVHPRMLRTKKTSEVSKVC